MFGNKNQAKKDAKKDGFIYKTFTMRNKFTDPTIISKKKNPSDADFNPTDVVQQEIINKQVEKKFNRQTAHSTGFRRNFDPLSLNKRNFNK